MKWTPPDPAPSYYEIDVFEGANVADTTTELDANNNPRAVAWTTRGKSATSARLVLTLGKTYTVSVRARNHAEADGFKEPIVSEWSTPVKGTIEMKPLLDAPGPVTGLTVKQAYTSGVEVEWTPPDPAPTGYYWVEAYNTTSRVVEKSWSPGSKATSAYIPNLAENTAYTIRVKSRNCVKGVGCSDYSTVAEVSVTTATPTAPGAVTGLAFDSDKTTATSLVATWTAPDPAPTGKYIIELFSGSSATGTPLTIRHRDPGLALKAKFTELTKSTQYTVRVKAQNAYDHKIVAGVAATATGTTGPAAGLPGRPINLTFVASAFSSTGFTMTVSWDSPLGTNLGGRSVQKYYVRIALRGEDGMENSERVSKTPTARSHSFGMSYCTEYRVQVRTVTAIGVSAWATAWVSNRYQKTGAGNNIVYTDKCATTE